MVLYIYVSIAWLEKLTSRSIGLFYLISEYFSLLNNLKNEQLNSYRPSALSLTRPIAYNEFAESDNTVLSIQKSKKYNCLSMQTTHVHTGHTTCFCTKRPKYTNLT